MDDEHQPVICGPIPRALYLAMGWDDLGIPVLSAVGEGELAIIGHMIPVEAVDPDS